MFSLFSVYKKLRHMKSSTSTFKLLVVYATALFALINFNNSQAQQMVLDPSFDADGVKALNPNFYGSAIMSIAQQADGNIVAAGTGTEQFTNRIVYIISRYLLNGDLDTSFASGGIFQNGFDSVVSIGRKILIQPDGKILAGGYTGANPTGMMGVIRLNSNGTLDTTFNLTGSVLFNITPDDDLLMDMILQPDGKILLGGYSTSGNGSAGSFLIRILPDATLDTTFNSTGILQNSNYLSDVDQCLSLALQPDGKIITLAGTWSNNTNRHLLKRYNANGILDTTFATGGTMIASIGINDDVPGIICLQPDGKFIVAGYTMIPSGGTYSYSDIAIGRFNTDGSIDSTFNFDGKIVFPVGHKSDVPTALRLDSIGNIFIAGYTDNGPPCALCIDYDMILVKLTSNGLIDQTFGSLGSVMINWGMQDNIAWDMLIQQDGKFLLAGDFAFGSIGSQMALVRLMPETTGINNVSSVSTLAVCPNPFHEQLTLLPVDDSQNMILQVTDVTGKIILSQSFNGKKVISTSNWKNGFYFYTLTDGQNKTTSGKLIKAD